MDFASFLKFAMEEKGFTAAYLSSLTGLSPPAIYYYLKGNTNPKPETLQKIEAALGMKYDEARTISNGPSQFIPYKKITLQDAARIMHISAQRLAEELQKGEFSDIGKAYKNKGSSKFHYHIIPKKLYELYGYGCTIKE